MPFELPPSATLTCYIAAAGVLTVGFIVNEPVCVWRAVTGGPCPGCGMTRALIALAACNWQAAWDFNPTSYAVAPILVWTGIRHLIRSL